jgi:hypothetical protein
MSIRNLPIRSLCRVILPITLISSSVILRRNKKLNKKYRRMIRILQISILVIFISQNLPFFRALVEMFLYYTNPSPYKDLNHFDFPLPSDYELPRTPLPSHYIEMQRELELVDSQIFVRENSPFSTKLYRFVMKGGSLKLFKQSIIISFRLLKWLIQSGNF